MWVRWDVFLIFKLFTFPIKVLIELITYIAQNHTREMVLTMLVGISYLVWYFATGGSADSMSVFAIERTLLAKLDADTLFMVEIDIFIFFVIFLLMICSSQLTIWNLAASYGCVASMTSATILSFIEMQWPSPMPRVLFFVLVLAFHFVGVYLGFRSSDTWIPPDCRILGLVVGIVPSLINTFISFCTILTFSFPPTEDNFTFVVIAIVLDIVIHGVGIVLFFMGGIKIKRPNVIAKSSNTGSVVAEKSDVTLNADIMEQIRKKNNK